MAHLIDFSDLSTVEDMIERPRAHIPLVIVSVMYWSSAIAVYFSFDLKCGEALPVSVYLLYSLVTSCCLATEFSVLKFCCKKAALRKMTMFKMVMEIGFGRLGHFDSFGDAAGAHLMQACSTADPEFFSWFSVWGHRFQLPTDLGTMMLVGMIIILLFQTLPALVLLISKQYMPVALKFNEFTLLLAAAECQFDTPS